jgi:hypothetical protein
MIKTYVQKSLMIIGFHSAITTTTTTPKIIIVRSDSSVDKKRCEIQVEEEAQTGFKVEWGSTCKSV